MFRAKHSGVSNPSLGLSYRVVRFFKITFVVYLTVSEAFYSLVRVRFYLLFIF